MLNFQLLAVSATENIINPETRHLFFPKIMTYTIAILLVLLVITHWKNIMSVIHTSRQKGKELDIIKNRKMFLGNLLLLFGYVFLLDLIGFVPSSLLYIFLTILLFYKSVSKKTVIMASTIASSVTIFIWILFGVLLNITLP